MPGNPRLEVFDVRRTGSYFFFPSPERMIISSAWSRNRENDFNANFTKRFSGVSSVRRLLATRTFEGREGSAMPSPFITPWSECP